MKDFFGAFGSEFFRPLATLLLPGTVALGPGISAAYLSVPAFRAFVAGNHAEAIGALIVAAVFIGLVLEDLGSRLECGLDNIYGHRMSGVKVRGIAFLAVPFREQSGVETNGDWYAYLRLAFQTEPVGHRYMRTLVLRLKFELGCCTAMPMSILGVWFWPTTYNVRTSISVLLIALSLYFGYEAFTTTNTLRKLRRELLKGIKVIAGAYDGPSLTESCQ